ncbi:reverse transcriptase domain-containing protein [Tanacetum coccineum]
MKENRVTYDAPRLFLFSYSLTHHATAWFDRLLNNYVHTFEEMVCKYFPPSMVTKLRNEISNLRQLPDESLFDSWERYKLLIDWCPNHNMLPDISAQRGESSSSITSSSSEIAALTQQMAEMNKKFLRMCQSNH